MPGVLTMIADVNWESITLGAAFVLGAVLATIATLRLLRVTANYLTRIDKEKKEDDL